jgi:glutamate-1-semialdehyde aminotransferase
MYNRQKPLHKGLGIIRRDNNTFCAALFSLSGEFPIHMPPIKRGKGPYLYDYDENRYVDFELSRGSLLFGHAPPLLCSMMKSWLSRGYAGGFPIGAENMLEERISDLIGCAVPGRWLFFQSEFEAAAALYYIMGRYFQRERGIVLGQPGTTSNGFLPFTGAMNMQHGSKRDPGRLEADWDFVVLSEGREAERDRTAEVACKVRKNGGLFVSDETDLARHARMRSGVSVYGEADIRVFGSYLSSGIPFGCIYFSELVKERMKGKPCYETFTDIASFSFSVPLYTVKSTLRSLDLLKKEGGMEGFLLKQKRFFSLLDGRYFDQDEGLVYLKRGMLKKRYPMIRLDLLKRGIYLPLSADDPLIVSFAHTDELLKKYAGVMSSSVHEHVLGMNEGKR